MRLSILPLRTCFTALERVASYGVERYVGRHGERVWVDHDIHYNRSGLVGESFGQAITDRVGILNSNSLRAHCFCYCGEVRVLEFHSKGNVAGFPSCSILTKSSDSLFNRMWITGVLRST